MVETQVCPHFVFDAQLRLHEPLTQAWSTGHALPHAPQFLLSFDVSTQLAPQAASPPSHVPPPPPASPAEEPAVAQPT